MYGLWKIAKIYTHIGLKKEEVEEAKAGDIIEVAGILVISRNNDIYPWEGRGRILI